MVQLSGKGNDSSHKSKGGSGSVTVECTWSWRVRSIFFSSVRERAVFYKSCDLNGIIASGQYSSIRFTHSGRYPIRCVLSRLVRLMRLVALQKVVFRSRQLSDKWLINSLSLYLKSLWILSKNWFRILWWQIMSY